MTLGEKLHLLFSGPEAREGKGQCFKDYEAGKRRRYELLFAVNGGAFALAGWLADGNAYRSIRIGGLEAHHIGLGMAAFVAIMCLDLFAFGLRFREFFGLPGKLVIFGLGSLLIAGWLLAGGVLPGARPSALLLPVLVAVIMALIACICARKD